MNNKTLLCYLLSGYKYYKIRDSKDISKSIKYDSDGEIKYFFNKRYFRNESWYLRYLKILAAVFTVNILARHYERWLSKKCLFLNNKYSVFAPATYYALRAYNSNMRHFNIKISRDIFISDMIYEINERVKNYFINIEPESKLISFIYSNTPIGIELEFTNVGPKAGKFFVSEKGDPLLNFSKYHHYHLKKFLWRFGAYIDSEMPFKQLIKKGGFLEYTFTRPDSTLASSIPLTNSPQFASKLIEEAVRFTPVRPHSLHITLESPNDGFRRPKIGFEESLFILMCTGQFIRFGSKVFEARIMEKNMKDIFLSRKRKNDGKWVDTIEFSNMRLCRDFVKRGVYEPSIFVFIAFKNLFQFDEILPFSHNIEKWGENPDYRKINEGRMFEILEKGLEFEKSLPIKYKEVIILKIKDNYRYNCSIIGA
jgi:hypothetical protein